MAGVGEVGGPDGAVVSIFNLNGFRKEVNDVWHGGPKDRVGGGGRVHLLSLEGEQVVVVVVVEALLGLPLAGSLVVPTVPREKVCTTHNTRHGFGFGVCKGMCV